MQVFQSINHWNGEYGDSLALTATFELGFADTFLTKQLFEGIWLFLSILQNAVNRSASMSMLANHFTLTQMLTLRT